MQTAYVVEAEFIDNQTIHIKEPLNLENKNVLVTIQPSNENKKSKKRLFGKYKGKIWMSPDFNDPLEEFKEYM